MMIIRKRKRGITKQSFKLDLMSFDASFKNIPITFIYFFLIKNIDKINAPKSKHNDPKKYLNTATLGNALN